MKAFKYLPVWVHKPITDKGTAFSLVPANIDSVYWNKMKITPQDAELMKIFLDDTRKNIKEIPEVNFIPKEIMD